MNDYFASIVHSDRMAEFQRQAASSRLAAAGARKRRPIGFGGFVLTCLLAIALLAVLLVPGAI